MKHFSLFALLCLLAAGCANHGSQPTMENGNGVGGANVAGSFPGSSGAGSRTATGSNQSAPSTDPGPR